MNTGLNVWTAQVAATNAVQGNGDRIATAGASKIHHVIYIIKENRTYDQVFGDLREANGDRSLTMYGEEITPNQHKLARQFGILDNFYDSDFSGRTGWATGRCPHRASQASRLHRRRGRAARVCLTQIAFRV